MLTPYPALFNMSTNNRSGILKTPLDGGAFHFLAEQFKFLKRYRSAT
jgi:hypothetical protein